MNIPCLFCLEDIQGNPTVNPIGCQCKIHAHEACFQTWFEQKQSLECPICHTVSIPSPLHHENIHIVFVERQERRSNRPNQKAIAICCCFMITWVIGMTILESIYQAIRN